MRNALNCCLILLLSAVLPGHICWAQALDVVNSTGDTLFHVQDDGKVGIGITNPASKLHISAEGTPDIKITSTGPGWSPSLTFATTSDRWRIKRVGSGGFAIEDLGSGGGSGIRLFINNDGNVGIGTLGPNFKLDVGGDINFSGSLFQNGSPFGGGSLWSQSGNDIFYNNGNVGIGTTTPSAKMHIMQDAAADAFRVVDQFFATQFIVVQNGDVGIGTAIPLSKLHVRGTPDLANFVGQIKLMDPVNLIRSLNLGYQNISFAGFIQTTRAAVDPFFPPLALQPNGGNVGIGTTSPNNPLEMGSGAHVTVGGVWTDASSREYKENIRDLTVEEALAALGELRPTRFNYKIEKEEEHVGFIAEEVPELVANKERKGLSAMDIVAVLTKVVQQQQKKIEQLEARLNAGQ